MHDATTPGDPGGHVQDAVAKGGDLAVGDGGLVGKADELRPGHEVGGGEYASSQAWFSGTALQGRLRRPAALAWRIRSSTRAWRRWRSSRRSIEARHSLAVVSAQMKAVWRSPSISSKRLSWAPGWGRSVRTITREPSGQAERSKPGDLGHPGTLSDLSVVLDRGDPGVLLERNNGLAHIFGDGKPEAEADFPLAADAAKPCVAPAASARTTRRGPCGSPGRGRAASGSASRAMSRHRCGRRWCWTLPFPRGRYRPAPHPRRFGTIQETQQRMKTERVLPGRRSQFLVRVGDHDGGVDVEAQLARKVRRGPRRPGRGTRAARPARDGKVALETRSSTRQAVDVEATGPKSPGWSRTTSSR